MSDVIRDPDADRAVTSVCNDGSFRVITLRTTRTVQTVLD